MKVSILIIIFLSFLDLSFLSSASIEINEVMYDPLCPRDTCEWVELYNFGNETIILDDCFFNDKKMSGSILSNHYLILTKNNADFLTNFGLVENILELSLNLANTGKKLILSGNENCSDEFNYTQYTHLANNNGYSLEKISSGNSDNSNDDWGASLVLNGTPNHQNSLFGKESISLDYSNIKISEFLPDPEGNDSAPLPNGEWIELFNPSNQNLDLKWFYFKDSAGSKLFITETTTANGSTIIPAEDYLVVYTNGKSRFLNNGGEETIYLYDSLNNPLQDVSYADPLEGNSYAYVEKVGWQQTKPTPGEENIDYETIKESKFEIKTVLDLGSDSNAKFGQTIRVQINLYKGDATKKVLSIWAGKETGKISKETKITLPNKYTETSLAVPIQLIPNCNQKYEDGAYDLFIGWINENGSDDTLSFDVKGITDDLCEKVTVAEKSSESSSNNKKFSYELISKPTSILTGESFEVQVKLENNLPQESVVKLWGYLYRGNKCYSCLDSKGKKIERDANTQEITLGPNEAKTIKLSLKSIENIESGNYNLKVKINLNSQKTDKEITETILIQNLQKCTLISPTLASKVANSETDLFEKSSLLTELSDSTGLVVFESNSEITKKTIPFVLIITLFFILLILIWKQKEIS